MMAGTALTPAEVRAQLEEHRGEIETAEHNGHRVVREPLAYQYGGPSYYRDLFLAEVKRNSRAGERLEHHRRQMVEIGKHRETREFPGTEIEYRVNPNLETGHGSEFAPPTWLNQLFATARRPGKIIQRLVQEHAQEFDMPAGTSSINLPRITQGTFANDETPGAPANSQDVETEKVKAQAILYGGISDWAIQDLEQSPPGAHLDWVVFTDLEESLHSELEADLITGKGESYNEPLGLLNIPGINEVTFTAATPTGMAMMPFLGQAAAQAGSKRKRPPTAWLMTSNRFFWLAFAEDLSNRPLSIEDYPLSDFPNAGLGSVGVYMDDAIPQTLGVSKEQDAVFACRPEGFMLWHSQPITAVLEDVLSGSLQVRFRLHRTTASMLHRYPSAVSAIQGTGMKVQAGWS